MTASPNISVCVPTRNRPQYLRACLNSIQRSDLQPIEIVVSEDSDKKCVAETKRIALSFSKVKYVEGPKKGASANRNNCLIHVDSKAEFVSFIDDDALMYPDFFDNILSCYRNAKKKYATEDIIVTGSRDIGDGSPSLPPDIDFIGSYRQKPLNSQFIAVHMISNLFPVKLFEKIRFDENIPWCNERDISLHAISIGYKIVGCPRAVVYHPIYSHEGSKSNFERNFASLYYFGLKRYWLYEHSVFRFLTFNIYVLARSTTASVFKLHFNRLPLIVRLVPRSWRRFLHFVKEQQ